MLVGWKDKDRGIFNYLLTLRGLFNKRNGLTLVEVLVTAFIVVIVFATLLFTLNTGNLSSAVSGAKLEVQQDVRRAMDWMVKDLRQTRRDKLTVPNPTPPPDRITFVEVENNTIFTDPEFQICDGYDNATGPHFATNQIGYSFDASNEKIVRSESDTSQTWEFKHITNLEFRKISRNLLRVTVSGEKTIRGTIKPTFTLEEEVKLRNE